MSKQERRSFLISPVRKATDEEILKIGQYVEELSRQNIIVHWPYTDTPQLDDPVGLTICTINLGAIKWTDQINYWWSESSVASTFDAGSAFALRKPFSWANRDKVTNMDQNLLELYDAWAEESRSPQIPFESADSRNHPSKPYLLYFIGPHTEAGMGDEAEKITRYRNAGLSSGVEMKTTAGLDNGFLTPLEIAKNDRRAITECGEVRVWYSKENGPDQAKIHFDLGMAFALNKKIRIACPLEPKPYKSFQNVLLKLNKLP